MTVKTTGLEKTRISVCLTAKAVGTKLRPFIFFKGAKQKTAVLDKKIKSCCMMSFPNVWMRTELTHTHTYFSIVPRGCIKYIQTPDAS